MIKLLLQSLLEYIDAGHRRTRHSDGFNTVVVYEVESKEGIPFTRIDIFTKQAKHARA